jgi:hypothetical protein
MPVRCVAVCSGWKYYSLHHPHVIKLLDVFLYRHLLVPRRILQWLARGKCQALRSVASCVVDYRYSPGL